MSEDPTPADRTRLADLFAQAVDLPEAERAAFLDAECGPDPRMREELECLLEALAGEDHLGAMRGASSSRTGTRIGAYELLERVGEGGMGEVYAAQQHEPIRRRVALKIIKPGMDSAQVTTRFEAERQALAHMAHPNIAQVHDGGTTESGSPYFVMEYIAGAPITQYCDRHQLSTRARLELFLAVCDGVQHAHQKGIIHRDLKPSNLLVAEESGRAVPKIIDFGIARATSGRLVDRTLNTVVGQIVGTLDYMSPEQADPSSVEVDTRSDIYSLGVVLYQLLSGMLPFEHHLVGDQPLSEIQRAIREKDPPTPSARLRSRPGTASSMAPLRGTDEHSLVRQLSGDLDWICLKALEKDPARRYGSASQLAEDVSRHLADVPVLARRPAVLYRARKFVRRHRVGVTAAALVAVSALAGLAGLASAWLEGLAGERLQVAFEPLEAHYAVSRLHAEAEGLWPPHPEKISEMEGWLEEAEERWGRHQEWTQLRDALRRGAQPVRRRMLEELIVGLESLSRDLLSPAGVTAEHGWSVSRRLAFARELEREFGDEGLATAAWSEALPRIRRARADLDGDGVVEEGIYAGFDPPRSVRMGLLPIGPDPDSGIGDDPGLGISDDPESGLWLFLDLATDGRSVSFLSSLVAAEPERAGELIRSADSRGLPAEAGLVLVLIPGGHFTMGAQWEDPEGQNYDEFSRYPQGFDLEQPVVDVEVPAFFLSKYEMTRLQWTRVAGPDPIQGERKSLMSPVGLVDWEECNRVSSRLGLGLPLEEQWEYAVRASTTSPWSTGDEVSSLEGYANLFDQTAKGKAPNWPVLLGSVAEIDDGSLTVTPVGTYDPNPWGLFDVHGNAQEWCSNLPYLYGTSKDRLGPDSEPGPNRVSRGGSARTGAEFARSASRLTFPIGFKNQALGLRPAREITP